METDTKIVRKRFIVETEVTITRRYRVMVREDENPWDMWERNPNYSMIIDKSCSPEKAVSVERIKED